MNFYKVTFEEEVVCFRTEKVLYSREEVVQFAVDNHFIEKGNAHYQAEKIFLCDYIEYLLQKMIALFQEEYQRFQKRLETLSIDEVCNQWDEIAARKDALYLLSDGDVDFFEYEPLEKWLASLDVAVQTICKMINKKDYSEQIEHIYSVFNREGLED